MSTTPPPDWWAAHQASQAAVDAERAAADAAIAAARDENDARLTTTERKAIISLRNLARRWPKTLTLISMDGGLIVVRTSDDRLHHWNPDVQEQAIIQTVIGIPTDGGGW